MLQLYKMLDDSKIEKRKDRGPRKVLTGALYDAVQKFIVLTRSPSL